MKYSLIVFDWDGTLADSTGRIVESMQTASRACNLPLVTDQEVQNIIGLGLPEALLTLWPGLQSSELETMRQQYAQAFVQDAKTPMGFFEGVPGMLQSLSNDYVLAVATGKSRKGLDRILAGLPEAELFATTRCADETKSKPHPLMLEEILRETNTPIERALMVGDTSYDLNMAATIGMDALAVGYGAHSESTLRACEPLAVCRSISELQTWVETNG